jgi:catechol 2,3-dioxygenase-like lactoylglutathione lyase family enzyme
MADGTQQGAADVRLDHMIVPARDARASAEFLCDVFGLPAPEPAGDFQQVRLSDGRLLDYDEWDEPFPSQHLAFLVDEPTFDRVLRLIREQGIEHWADPGRRRPGETYTMREGRGVYFCDPSGHFLEALTARYDGSALT